MQQAESCMPYDLLFSLTKIPQSRDMIFLDKAITFEQGKGLPWPVSLALRLLGNIKKKINSFCINFSEWELGRLGRLDKCWLMQRELCSGWNADSRKNSILRQSCSRKWWRFMPRLCYRNATGHLQYPAMSRYVYRKKLYYRDQAWFSMH